MNQHARIAPEPGPHRFTRQEALRLSEADVFGGRRFELLNGDIYLVPGEGLLHQGLRERLVKLLYEHIFAHRLELTVSSNGPIRLSDYQEPEPDIYVRPASLKLDQVGGAEALLVIEICVSTQEKDFEVKPPIYAAHGVRDYWLIEPEQRRSFVRRGPQADGSWAEEREIAAEAPIAALLIPGFALTPGELLA